MARNKNDFIFFWDMWILLLISYSAVEIPLGIVVGYSTPVAVYILNGVAVSSFIADVIIRFKSKQEKKKKYSKRWLIIDVLAAVPFELLALIGGGIVFTTVVRSFRLLKVFRVASFKPLWEYYINLNPSIVRLGFFFYFVLLSMHWIACGWVYLRIHPAGADMIHEYVKALYWSTTTVTTIGYGDITPDHSRNIELVYTMAVQLFGAASFGYIVGNIATLLTNLDVAKTRHRERVDMVDNFMKSKKLPKRLQERVHHYYDYLWESRQGYDDAAIFSELPESFKYEFATVLNREILKKVPMFKGADHNMLREIAVCLVPCIYTPGDAICSYGEVGDKMYFIKTGHVEVTSRDGKEVYATLKEGDFFGEVALLLKRPRNATIRSTGYCDLYSLNKDSFDRVISDYPDFEKNIQQMARERMNNA